MALTKAQQVWVDALRSGEFQQGSGMLCDEFDNYCCLGVACELGMRQGLLPRDKFLGDDGTLAAYPTVMEWLNLRNPEGFFVNSSGRSVSLAQLNDGTDGHSRMSFAALADLIQSEPWRLFESPKTDGEVR